MSRPTERATVPDGRARRQRRAGRPRLRWTEHRAQRRAAFVAAGVDAIDEHGAGRQRRADRRRGRRQPHRPVPLLPRPDDLRQAIADHVVRPVIDSVCRSCVLDAESTPREIITAAIGDDHRLARRAPEPLPLPARAAQRPSLDAVETTLADRVAALLQGADDVLRHRRATRPSPARTGSSASSSPAGAWWLRTATSRRRCRASGSPTASARRLAPARGHRPRERHHHRLRRPAAARGAGAEVPSMTDDARRRRLRRAGRAGRRRRDVSRSR